MQRSRRGRQWAIRRIAGFVIHRNALTTGKPVFPACFRGLRRLNHGIENFFRDLLRSDEVYSARSRVRQLASGLRQLAGTKTRCHWAHAAPLAGLISGRVEYSSRFPAPGRESGTVELTMHHFSSSLRRIDQMPPRQCF